MGELVEFQHGGLAVEDKLSPAVRRWLSAVSRRREQEARGVVSGGQNQDPRNVVPWQLVQVPDLPESDRATAMSILEAACQPMRKREIVAGLGRVKAMTVSRAEDDVSTAVRFEIYVEELAKWPADVVRHVLESQPRMSKFWPAWAELEERLELYAGKRMRALELLRGVE